VILSLFKKKEVFIVKPAKKNIQNLKDKIKEITKDKNLSALDLIQILNPVLMVVGPTIFQSS